MTARRRANDVISPLRAFLFAAALSTALVLVLAPVFPGETHVSAGDPAFKTFRLNGEVVASKGAALDQDTINRIREAGLLDNTTEADAAAAAVMIGVIGASLQALQMPVAFLLGGFAGIFAVRRAERVNHYAMAGVAVGALTFAALFAFWLLSPEREGVDLFWILIASGLTGFGCAVITVGATVVLGVIFGVTTRIQLMELSQLSHPLLRELQEKAPGTFHHSVIVGNLAERAADLIGADSLLVRVGCYFHDIGKIAKPEYYIENQIDTATPHDKLQPNVSARLVSEHVRIGLKLTGRYRLPARVRAFIPEHHGTRLVTYFYRKASAHDPSTDPEKFRYPGPRPQSRETAIVMLADSVEAVVRSSRDRSQERIGS